MKSIGIVGTGMIGSSLAVLTATHQMKTVVIALNMELMELAKKQITYFLSELVNKQLLTEVQAQQCEDLLVYSCEYEDLVDCSIVFEAVIEDLNVKQDVYRKIEANTPQLDLICSVSSAIETDKLAEGLNSLAEKILVTHPFFPPHMIPYFEISPGSSITEEKLSQCYQFLLELDRKPVILQKSIPGFIGNRLQFALWREALYLVSTGVCSPQDIDTCLKYSFCPRYTKVGIFEHFDNGGLELNARVCQTIFPTLSNQAEVPEILQELLKNGHTGVKVGKGFYEWDEESALEINKRASKPFEHFFVSRLDNLEKEGQ